MRRPAANNHQMHSRYFLFSQLFFRCEQGTPSISLARITDFFQNILLLTMTASAPFTHQAMLSPQIQISIPPIDISVIYRAG
jgi:hypothetical protein